MAIIDSLEVERDPQQLREAGFSDDEISRYSKYKKAGFTHDEIVNHLRPETGRTIPKAAGSTINDSLGLLPGHTPTVRAEAPKLVEPPGMKLAKAPAILAQLEGSPRKRATESDPLGLLREDTPKKDPLGLLGEPKPAEINDWVEVPVNDQKEILINDWKEVPVGQKKAVPQKSIGGFISNVGKNAVDVAKGVATAVTHPIQTVKNVGTAAGNIMYGAAEKLAGEPPGSEEQAAFERVSKPVVEAVTHPLKIPGMGFDYLYEKPVDAALMVSGGLGLAGKAAKAGGLAKTAKVLETAATVTDPLTVPGKVAKPVVGAIGKATKEIVGTLTGAGPGFIEEAVKANPAFAKAMRGKITGEEIVDHARDALQELAHQRASTYRTQLANLPNQFVDVSPIQLKLRDLMKQFNVKVTPEGTIDTSRAAMGKAGKGDIEEVINRVWDHGNKPGDKTVLGLDGLKRELDDFYSESSRARTFVASLRNQVSKTIGRNVPEYTEMTKGYADATSLMKDIESNLLLKKQGMSGRITADNVLRRLSSALRENFEMRKDLLQTLGTESGMDIIGEVAGYAGKKWTPWGIQGKLLIAGGGYYLLKAFNPKFWPILLASSPRVVGEFLNAYGKAAKKVRGPIKRTVEIGTKPEVLAPLGLAGRVEKPRRTLSQFEED